MRFFTFFLSLSLYLLISITSKAQLIQNKPVKKDYKAIPIKIAVVLPVEGAIKQTGIDLAKSLLVARDFLKDVQYNREFAERFTFDIRLFNDSCTDKGAKKTAQQIINSQKFLFVIGHFCSVSSLAAAPLYSDAGIIQISPFSTDATLTEQEFRTFFRLAGRSDRYGEVAADWLKDVKISSKLATIYSDPIYGKTLVKSVILGLDLQKNEIQNIPNNDPDFHNYYKTPINFSNYQNNLPALITLLKKEKIELVFFGGYYSKLLPFLKAIRRANLPIKIITGNSAQSHAFWRQSNKTANGVIFTLSKDYTRDIAGQDLNKAKRAQDFYQYRAKYGLEEAIREYGIQASRSIFERNRAYRDLVLFMRAYYERFNRFPDIYMVHLFATLEIFENILLQENFEEKIMAFLGKNLSPIEIRLIGYEIADYMKSKGFNISEEKVGFDTVIGPVNFSLTGEWQNIEYGLYQWIDRQQSRPWLSNTGEEEYLGQQGDFMRLF